MGMSRTEKLFPRGCSTIKISKGSPRFSFSLKIHFSLDFRDIVELINQITTHQLIRKVDTTPMDTWTAKSFDDGDMVIVNLSKHFLSFRDYLSIYKLYWAHVRELKEVTGAD